MKAISRSEMTTSNEERIISLTNILNNSLLNYRKDLPEYKVTVGYDENYITNVVNGRTLYHIVTDDFTSQGWKVSSEVIRNNIYDNDPEKLIIFTFK